MRDFFPEVDFPESIQGVGRLQRNSVTIPVASFSLERGKHDFGLPWTFTAHVAREHWEDWEHLTQIGRDPIQFVGTIDSGRAVIIPRVHWQHLIRGRMHAEIFEWHLDTEPATNTPTHQHLLIYLTPTALARSETGTLALSPTGVIDSIDDSASPPVVWASALGEARFSRRYTYEHASVGGTKSLVRIPGPVLSINVAASRRTGAALSLSQEITDELQDALRVISFLSRRHVRWYRILISSRWINADQTGDYSDAELHQSVGGKLPNTDVNPLINPHRLPVNALGEMIEQFRKLPFKESAGSAIVYLIESRHAGFVDAKFSNAFTALEALISGYGDANSSNVTMGTSQFKALRRQVEASIRTFASSRNLDQNTLEQIIAKIPELRRRPIVQQVANVVDHFGVAWRDLWPDGSELDDVLRQAYSRRNRFIHAGHLPSVRQAHVDAVRIHTIAERILYAMIGGESDWFDWRTYEHTADLHLIESNQV